MPRTEGCDNATATARQELIRKYLLRKSGHEFCDERPARSGVQVLGWKIRSLQSDAFPLPIMFQIVSFIGFIGNFFLNSALVSRGQRAREGDGARCALWALAIDTMEACLAWQQSFGQLAGSQNACISFQAAEKAVPKSSAV